MRYVVSPRNKRFQGATPKFVKFDKIEKFIVIEYIGYSTVHPGKGTILSKEHHWYRVRCTCGTSEIQTQQQLTDKRRVHACAVCLKEIKEFIDDSSHERIGN